MRHSIALIIFICTIFQLAGCSPTVIQEKADEENTETNQEEKEVTYLPYIQKIQMNDKLNGWIVVQDPDMASLKTTDGGVNWLDVSPKDRIGSPFYILDQDHIWFTHNEVDDKELLYTSDGGINWSKSEPFTSDSQTIGIHFIDKNNGWMTNFVKGIGAGGSQIELAKTEDGGKSWTIVASEEEGNQVPIEGYKSSAYFSSLDTGWIPVFANGSPWVYNSRDGGHNWLPYPLPILEDMPQDQFFQVASPIFFNELEGVIPVYFITDQVSLYLYTTKDAGESWSVSLKQELPLSDGSYQLDFDAIDVNNVWVLVNQKSIYNYRTNWTEIKVEAETKESRILALDFINETDGWMAIGDDTRSVLYQTRDSGVTWSLPTK